MPLLFAYSSSICDINSGKWRQIVSCLCVLKFNLCHKLKITVYLYLQWKCKQLQGIASCNSVDFMINYLAMQWPSSHRHFCVFQLKRPLLVQWLDNRKCTWIIVPAVQGGWKDYSMVANSHEDMHDSCHMSGWGIWMWGLILCSTNYMLW